MGAFCDAAEKVEKIFLARFVAVATLEQRGAEHLMLFRKPKLAPTKPATAPRRRDGETAPRGVFDQIRGKAGFRTRNFASGGPLQHFPEAVRYRGDARRNPVVTGRFDLLGEVLLREASQLFHDL